MQHKKLRKRLQEFRQNPPGEWANPSVEGLDLLLDLTDDDSVKRGRADTVKQRPFYTKHIHLLERPHVQRIDDLLDDPGPFKSFSKG
jgi:hypothetical protein